jgi:hypothetical protein
MRSYLSRLRRVMSALLTSAGDCSLLLTLTVAGNYNRKGVSANSGDGLRTALLPTLLAVDYGSNQGGAAGRQGEPRPSLQTMARTGTLSTLTARDAKGPAPKHTKGGRDLATDIGGHLNPEWCLWFMGFPAGYLDVDDAHVFARSGTRSSPSAAKSSAG